jgi:mannan endo-1,4-beta-mannosidase
MSRTLQAVAILFFLAIPFEGNLKAQFANFIARNGVKLMDGNQELRFISFNTPNLHYVEDYLPFTGTNPWRLPNEFEIRDALTTIKQFGGKVTRIYVLSVRRQDDTPDIRRHVDGPGLFNVDAFETLDKVLQVANEVGVRVIIPFVDNWKWWGGVAEYAAFRGKERDAFWTDPQLIADFEQTIEFLLNRTNIYTGTKYKDDKAIMAWETGNELVNPYSWTKTIAAYIKSLDTNHLVMEGTLGRELTQEALDDPNIDILSTHHYGDPKASLRYILSNQIRAKGKKPYLIGEYGIVPTQEIRAITDTIIHQGLAGGMIWSLRFRAREGGFYNHYEYNNVSSYRWPGFANGDIYDERTVLSILRQKAYEIDGSTEPPLPVPAKPTLLVPTDVSSISWEGSVGAQSYVIERQDVDSTDWTSVAADVDESKYQYRPLYSDQSAEFGRRYLYRIRAKNESGLSEYSNVIGPLQVSSKTIVDEMESFDRIFQKEGDLKLLTYDEIRKAKEDRSRLTGSNGSYIIYKLPAGVTSIQVDAFKPSKESALRFQADSGANAFKDLQMSKRIYTFGSNDYGFFDAISYACSKIPENTTFIRIILSEGIQIGRVELSYSQHQNVQTK